MPPFAFIHLPHTIIFKLLNEKKMRRYYIVPGRVLVVYKGQEYVDRFLSDDIASEQHS